MSGSVNKVILVGHLGRDPEVRRTQAGAPIVSFPVATGETWRDKATGERRQRTEWHQVVVFNEGLAKVAEQYLKKGSLVYVEGQQRTRKWTDKQNVERYSTETVLTQFGGTLALLDRAEKRPAAQSPDDYGSGDSRDAAPAADALPPRGQDLDDEIPF